MNENVKNKNNDDILFENNWVIYDHTKMVDYKIGFNPILKIGSVFEFWIAYEKLPRPYEFFYTKSHGSSRPYYLLDGEHREVSSISVFREGIFPSWEDPQNAEGGILEYRINTNTHNTHNTHNTNNINFFNILDKYWLFLCMYIMGHHYPDEVTGFRIVDSSIISQIKELYKIEIWMSNLGVSKQVETLFRKQFELTPENRISIKKHKNPNIGH